MSIRNLHLSVLALAALASVSLAARADVFRCVGTDGKTLYSDSPCPQDAVKKSNITDSIGACNTTECETKRQQTVNDARERLRAEKTELAEMTQKRMERERASLEEQRWRQAVESQMASAANEAAMAAGNPVYYPAYPLAIAGRPCRGDRCLRPDQRPHPNKPPQVSHHQKSNGLPLRVER